MSTINGVAKRYNGNAIDYVLLFDWISGKCIGKCVSDLVGNWSFDYYVNLNIGITYVADGCEPITHGSYQFIGIWIPQAIKDTSELKVWLDPSDLSTMFQDSGQTTPVTTDGQPVGLIKDKSGNNYHASQSVNAARPIYRTDGTLHWLDFNGTSQYLVIVDSNWFNTVSATTWIVGANISSDSQEYGAVISKINESYNGLALQTSEPLAGRIRAFGFRSNEIKMSGSIDSNTVFTVSFSDNEKLSLSKNKDALNSGLSGVDKSNINSNSAPFTIGSLSYADLFSKFNLYCLIITNTKLTNYRDPAIGYVAEKSGVTL